MEKYDTTNEAGNWRKSGANSIDLRTHVPHRDRRDKSTPMGGRSAGRRYGLFGTNCWSIPGLWKLVSGELFFIMTAWPSG